MTALQWTIGTAVSIGALFLFVRMLRRMDAEDCMPDGAEHHPACKKKEEEERMHPSHLH